MFLISCANKKDLISIIDDSCVDKELLLAEFLISRLSDTPY